MRTHQTSIKDRSFEAERPVFADRLLQEVSHVSITRLTPENSQNTLIDERGGIQRQRACVGAAGPAQTERALARNVPNHAAAVCGSHRALSGAEARLLAD